MKKIIDDKDQKIQKLLPKMKDTFKTGDFIEAFKTAFPEDYEMLEERFFQDERQTRSLDWKKNTIPTPEQYLKKAIKDFAKGHPSTLKSTVTGFKKTGKPAAKPSKPKSSAAPDKSKPAAKPETPKKTSKPVKTKSDAAKTKAKPAETKGKSKPAATPDTAKSAAKPKKAKTAGTSEKAKPAEKPAKSKTAKKTESKKPAAKKK